MALFEVKETTKEEILENFKKTEPIIIEEFYMNKSLQGYNREDITISAYELKDLLDFPQKYFYIYDLLNYLEDRGELTKIDKEKIINCYKKPDKKIEPIKKLGSYTNKFVNITSNQRLDLFYIWKLSIFYFEKILDIIPPEKYNEYNYWWEKENHYYKAPKRFDDIKIPKDMDKNYIENNLYEADENIRDVFKNYAYKMLYKLKLEYLLDDYNRYYQKKKYIYLKKYKANLK